jgi:hypothetical protein
MIVKFFSNKGGGSPKASLDYLLNKPGEHAQILKGDPILSRAIAESSQFSNAYTVGCLSFEELSLGEEDKRKIINLFEKAVFAGLSEDQFNITWIQHTDKNRLELNFFIPNTELTTGKRLQPYYDKADRPLIENFKQVINHEFNLSDPNEPSRKQMLITRADLPLDKKNAQNAIHDGLQALLEKGMIKNLDDLIKTLEQAGFEIARVTPKSISIKTEGQNLRLKGAMYEQTFEFSEAIRGRLEERSRAYDREREIRYQRARMRLENAIDARQSFFKQNYRRGKSEAHLSHDSSLAVSCDPVGDISRVLGCDFGCDHVSSSERVSRDERLESLSGNIQETKSSSIVQPLHHGRQNKKTLRADRSEVSRPELGRQSNSENNLRDNQNDRDRNVIRERIENLVSAARSHYQKLISSIELTRGAKSDVSSAIQRHSEDVKQFNKFASVKSAAKDLMCQLRQNINVDHFESEREKPTPSSPRETRGLEL